MNAPQTALALAPEQSAPAVPSTVEIFSSPAMLGSLMQFADIMAKSVVTVPKHLHGKPSDCLAITLQAMRWRMDPYIVASKTHVVNGNLGYEAQLIVAVLKNSGAVRGRPHFEHRGDGQALESRAGFIPAGETDVVWTEWLASKDITVKNSPLWKTNPKQQMGYVQARNWARLYAPEALLGVYTDDELDSAPPESGTRHMGAVDEVKPAERQALPPYADDAFARNLPGWQKLVTGENGKTAQALLAKLSTKATFSEEQKAAILALKPVAPEPAQTAAGEKPDPEFVAALEAGEGGGK